MPATTARGCLRARQYDAANNTVTLTVATAIPEGTYRLDVGLSDGGSETIGTAIRVGTLFNQNRFSHNGYLRGWQWNTRQFQRPRFLRVDFAGGANLRIELTQHDAAMNASVRWSTPAELAAADPAGAGVWGFTVPARRSQHYYIEVFSSDGSTGSYRIDASVTASGISTSDNNSTFGTATNLGSLAAPA